MSENPAAPNHVMQEIQLDFWNSLAGFRDEWQNSQNDVASPLFHYTTTASMMSICETRSIWATDVFYLNDASEFTYAIDLVNQVANEVYGDLSSELQEHFQHDPLSEFFAIAQRRDHPFVASFCENGDLLSQWRGYSKGDAGVALGLWLRPLSGRDNFMLRKVIYEPEEQRRLVRTVVEAWVTAYRRRLTEVGAPQKPDWSVLSQALDEQLLSFKHPGFAEEQEWRLITRIDPRHEMNIGQQRQRDFVEYQYALERARYTPASADEPTLAIGFESRNVKFRAAGNGLVPYVEISLEETGGVRDGLLPLLSVVQGPRESPDLARESLRFFWESNGYDIGPIKTSGIPLREN